MNKSESFVLNLCDGYHSNSVKEHLIIIASYAKFINTSQSIKCHAVVHLQEMYVFIICFFNEKYFTFKKIKIIKTKKYSYKGTFLPNAQ